MLSLIPITIFRQKQSSPAVGMATKSSNAADPPAIRKKLDALRRQRKTIEDLTARLETAQLKYNHLEQEINEYRASIAAVRKCPEEVLVMIFELFAKRRPWKVTHLLPVCQRWYNIAMNAPQLWNCITVTFKRTWDVEAAASIAKKEISACLQRSALLPLHIVLDFSDMQTEEVSLKARATEFLLQEDPQTEYDEIRCFFECMRFSGMVEDRPFMDETGRLRIENVLDRKSHWTASSPGHAWEAISLLTGEQGEHMKRWSSLELLLPDPNAEELSLEIRPLLCGATPNLTKLNISSVTFLERSHASEPFEWLPDLSSLKELTLDGEVRNMDFLKLDFTSIKRLSLEISLRHHYQSLQLSQFTSLEHLTVEGTGDSDLTDSESEDSVPNVISLPLLQTLTLAYQINNDIVWDVPTLQILKLKCRASVILEALPEVQALHVCWTPSQVKQTERGDCRFQRSLRSITSKYAKMQKLTIRAFLRPIWEEIVKSLGEEERSALPTVVFLAKNEDINIF